MGSMFVCVDSIHLYRGRKKDYRLEGCGSRCLGTSGAALSNRVDVFARAHCLVSFCSFHGERGICLDGRIANTQSATGIHTETKHTSV